MIRKYIFKFLLLGAFLKAQQVYGQQSAQLVTIIPFEVQAGAMILHVKLNDSVHPLKLLFDTGADGMAIKQRIADSVGLKVSRKQNASVVGGNLEISVSEGNTVHLDSFEFKNQRIAIFKEVGGNTDGIIGNSLIKRYITKIDFDRKELSLYSFGDYQYEGGGKVLPFTQSAGIFLIPGSLVVGTEPAHQGRFVFDTGAAYSLICFRPFVKQNKLLVSGFKSEYVGSTVSMGVSTPTFTGKVTSFSFSDRFSINNLPVTLMAGGGQNENWNPGFDGSIGLRLISRYNCTINLQKSEIYLKPNQSFDYPQDFVIGDYIFGFNLEGELVVRGLISEKKPEMSLDLEDKIKSINGISAQNMLKDVQKLVKLLSLPAGTDYNIESVQHGEIIKNKLYK